MINECDQLTTLSDCKLAIQQIDHEFLDQQIFLRRDATSLRLISRESHQHTALSFRRIRYFVMQRDCEH